MKLVIRWSSPSKLFPKFIRIDIGVTSQIIYYISSKTVKVVITVKLCLLSNESLFRSDKHVISYRSSVGTRVDIPQSSYLGREQY